MTHPIYILTDAQGKVIAVDLDKWKLHQESKRFTINALAIYFGWKKPFIITPGQAVWEDKKI